MTCNDLTRSLISCSARLLKLLELNAPEILIERELQLIEKRLKAFPRDATVQQHCNEIETDRTTNPEA